MRDVHGYIAVVMDVPSVNSLRFLVDKFVNQQNVRIFGRYFAFGTSAIGSSRCDPMAGVLAFYEPTQIERGFRRFETGRDENHHAFAVREMTGTSSVYMNPVGGYAS
jgi:hypothetical protein